MNILPNGNVQIKNFQTGEVKEITPGELPTYGGDTLLNQYIKLKGLEKTNESAGFQVGSSPSLSTTLPTGGDSPFFDSKTPIKTDTSPTLPAMPSAYTREKYQADLTRDIQTTGGKHATELKQLFEASNPQEDPVARDRRKSEQSSSAVMSFINSLENSYKGAGGATYGIGPGARVKGFSATMAGKFGMNEDAAVYNDSKEGFAATLKSLTGDTGVLTDQDFARLSKLLPSLGSTKKESIDKFNQLRDQISAKFGLDKTQTSFTPKVENTRGVLPSMVDVVAPRTVDLAEKATADIKEQLKTGKYKNIVDLLFPKSEKDVGLVKDVLPAGLEVGSNIVAAEGLMGGAKKLTGNIFGGKEKAIVARKALVETIKEKAPVKSLVETGDEYIKRDPTAKAIWKNTLRPALVKQKELSAADLLDQIKIWGDAYNSAGKVGKTALAGINDALYRAGRDLAAKTSPELAALTKEIAKGYAREKLFSKFGPAVIGGVGSALGGFAVGSAMGQKR